MRGVLLVVLVSAQCVFASGRPLAPGLLGAAAAIVAEVGNDSDKKILEGSLGRPLHGSVVHEKGADTGVSHT